MILLCRIAPKIYSQTKYCQFCSKLIIKNNYSFSSTSKTSQSILTSHNNFSSKTLSISSKNISKRRPYSSTQSVIKIQEGFKSSVASDKQEDTNILSENVDVNLINHLERTSLVDFDNEEALARLQEAIRFADTLFQVDTKGILPLTSVLEDETLYLREDKPEVTNRDEILTNASVTEEDYFVAPPGNIPLEPQSTIAFKNSKS